MADPIVQVRKGTKNGQTVFWVVSLTKTGTHRIACCDDKETAEQVAATFRE
tara:strand:- start:312 stop:464 length:153 start_codon:yes stop_codon:yes gene_type:complete